MTEQDAVEQVLAGMGQATPADGIEARVLARLEAASPDERLYRPAWASWRGFAVACVGGVLLSGVGALLILHSTDRKNVATHQGVPLSTGRQTVQAAAGSTIERSSIQNRYGTRKVVTNHCAVPPQQPRFQAIADSTAGLESFPAPPMPLTRQERLLLRLLAGGEQAELVATLAPGAAPLVRSKDNAEFSTFFAPAAVDPNAAPGNVPPPPDAALVLSTEHGTAATQPPTQDEHGGKPR